jgi:hypothetical protein
MTQGSAVPTIDLTVSILQQPSSGKHHAVHLRQRRDISQNLLNLVKLKADAKFKGTALAKKLPDPGQMAKDIIPFANGEKRNLPSTATEKDVKQALAEVHRAVRADRHRLRGRDLGQDQVGAAPRPQSH